MSLVAIDKIKFLVFDLDGTLYDISNGYMQRIRQNLFEMMLRKGYATTKEEAEQLWRPLFKKYNQSFRGLNAGGYAFTDDEYWTDHRAGMEDFFAPDLELKAMLPQIPHRKIIFTNCREKEAEHIMHLMSIKDCFETTYGANFMGEICKPDMKCFEMLLADLGCNADEILYFEDSVKNLRTAQSLGMHCVLIHSETANEEGAELKMIDPARRIGILEGFRDPIIVLETLNDGGMQLREALPDLFPK